MVFLVLHEFGITARGKIATPYLGKAAAAARVAPAFGTVNVRADSPDCLVTLSLTINETLKWLSSLPILMQESFWW